MAVTVKQLLTLNSFASARVIAGSMCLDNEVRRISTADAPVTKDDYIVSQLGDFCLTGFFFAKDSLAEMRRFMEITSDTGASGLCILDEYVQELPPEIIQYCNDVKLPVLLIDYLTPYADIIRDVMELIIADQKDVLIRTQLEMLLTGSLSQDAKTRLLRQLKPGFQSRIAAICLLPILGGQTPGVDQKLIEIFNMRALSLGTEFRDGALGLVSHNHATTQEIKDMLQYYIDEIRRVSPDAAIGVSSLQNRLSDCDTAIRHALIAGEVSQHANVPDVTYYENLGVMRLILLLRGRPELQQFINEIINPLLDYDKMNHANLFDTMMMFIKCDRDPRKTAEEMFLHVNTVRYRVSRAREIAAPRQSFTDFLESFAVASKIYRMI